MSIRWGVWRSRVAHGGIVTAGLLALTGVSAPSAGELESKRKSGPVMEIEPEEYDFGGVKQDQELVHEFTIKNTGDEDLEIRRIATTCGCAAAVPADRIVEPGETTKLEVGLETPRDKGVIQKSMSVVSNDGIRTVRVRAFVEVPE